MSEYQTEYQVDFDKISNLIFEITNKASNEADYIMKVDYQKILYLLKKKLDEESEIKNHLQFYWYKHGPYSTPVANEVSNSFRRGVLDLVELEQGNAFTLNKDCLKQRSKNSIEGETKETLSDIIKEYDFYEDRDKIFRMIYEDAPYEFQKFYRLEFYPIFDNIQSGFSLFTNPQYGKERLIEYLIIAEAKLPTDEEFEEFNSFFSRYSTLSSMMIENLDDDLYMESLDYLTDIGKEMWKVFCYKLRILEHDPYYESKVDEWENKYQNSLKPLAEKIGNLDSFVSNNIERNRDFSLKELRSSEDSPWGKITKELIQN